MLHHKYFILHFPPLRWLPDITNTILTMAKRQKKRYAMNCLLGHKSFSWEKPIFFYRSDWIFRDDWSKPCMCDTYYPVDSCFLIQLKTNRNRFSRSILYFDQCNNNNNVSFICMTILMYLQYCKSLNIKLQFLTMIMECSDYYSQSSVISMIW